MRIEKTNIQKVYTFNVEMDVDELWELYCLLDTHPYVEVAEKIQTVLYEEVPEIKKFKADELEETASV